MPLEFSSSESSTTVDVDPCNSMGRRKVLKSMLAATGGCAIAHLFMASRGLAATLVFDPQAQAAAAGGEMSQFPAGGIDLDAYIVRPTGDGKHPAVILVHSNQGLTDGVRDVARHFGAAGFVVLAPDMISRAGGTAKMKTPGEAARAVGQLSADGTVQDLRAAFAFIEKDPSVDPQKISLVGIGWGGWRSFMMATRVPTVYRVVLFYGATPTDEGALKNIQAPVLANYAQIDFRVTGNAVWTDKTMKEIGKKFTYEVYPNTRQNFFDATSPNYDAAAAKLAWTRTLEFLR